MSDPSSNLRKTKKAPLPGGNQVPGQRSVPFRSKPADFLEMGNFDDVLNQTASTIATTKRDAGQVVDKAAKNAPTDMDLMSSMMSRIAGLELQVKFNAKEIIEKDKKINILTEKIKLLQKYGDGPVGDLQQVQEAERKCQALQEQIQDMEDFLSDYGMVWLGSSQENEPRSSRVHGIYQELEETDSSSSPPMWRPETSLVSRGEVNPDFDKVLKNIEELNVLAGEGEKKIQHTVSGARFKTVDSIPLTLYANGIFMFNGPFRSYQDPETRQCMQDLTEGYFPSELQSRYPDGVPINVNDQRDVIFQDQRTQEFFPGTGLTLGGDTDRPSRLVPSKMSEYSSSKGSGPPVREDYTPLKLRQTTKPPVDPMSVEQFLNKLHPTITRDGKVVDVKSSVADLLKEETKPSTVTVVDTPVVKDIKERALSAKTRNSARTSPRIEVTTLRVKSETGDHTFILKLRFTDTIGDLRMHLDKQRKPSSADYDLVTSFPNRVYTDLSSTLEETGLTPNATVLMRFKKK